MTRNRLSELEAVFRYQVEPCSSSAWYRASHEWRRASPGSMGGRAARRGGLV